jgi:hypothetical protein
MGIRTALVLGTILAVLVGFVVAQGADLALPGNHLGYEPDQPLLFSHQLHAGELQINCLYCHVGAERSRHAGVPSEQVCMNCHKFVAAPLADVRAEEAAAAKEKRPVRPVLSPEIAKLYRAQALDDLGKPAPGATPRAIRWTRVHNLPDFVFFDHRSHLTAGLACATCHGPVDAMARVRQFSDLSMGWCVNCHRTANLTGLPDGRPANAPTDCSTCHY